MLLISKFKITGHSMEPTLKQNELIIISSIPYLFKNPRINDIVAIKSKENKIFIKRIKKITKNNYIVLGDNKNDSFDSRNFGPIKKEEIIGKYIYKL